MTRPHQADQAAPLNQRSLYEHNDNRSREAAARQASQAANALDILTLWLGGRKFRRSRWMEVLRQRADDDKSSLSDLAAGMSPPMTKSQFACQLARACRFAELVASSADGDHPIDTVRIMTPAQRQAVEQRTRRAAARRAAAARDALRQLEGRRLSEFGVAEGPWLDVLRRQAQDTTSSQAALAASMRPPMTKSAFAGQLARAFRLVGQIDRQEKRDHPGGNVIRHVGARAYPRAEQSPDAPKDSRSEGRQQDGLA